MVFNSYFELKKIFLKIFSLLFFMLGAYFTQSFVQEFKSKYDSWNESSNEEDKHLENLLLIIAFIYHFKVFNFPKKHLSLAPKGFVKFAKCFSFLDN